MRWKASDEFNQEWGVGRMPDPISPHPAAATGEGAGQAEQSEANPGLKVTSLLLGTPWASGHRSCSHYRLTLARQVVLQGHCGLLKAWLLPYNLDLPHLEDRTTQVPL